MLVNEELPVLLPPKLRCDACINDERGMGGRPLRGGVAYALVLEFVLLVVVVVVGVDAVFEDRAEEEDTDTLS